MKILLIGFMLKQDDVLQYKGASIAGNRMQLSYVENLIKIGHEVNVLSFVPISFFPKSRRLWIRSRNISLAEDISATSPGFLNLPFIKVFMQALSTKVYINKWLKMTDKSPKTIITFNAIYQIASPLMHLNLPSNVKKCCILADPPLIQLKNQGLVAYIKNHMFKREEKLISMYDGIITLNENSARHYAPQKPFIVIEGGVDERAILLYHHTIQDYPRRFVYAGALTLYSGCVELLEAFSKISHQNIELYFYGTGPMQYRIEEFAKHDGRIHYGGYLSSEKIQEIYRASHFLVNPRRTKDEISAYSFPSKLFDYLLSETPVLSTIFPGLPHEYIPYFHVLPSEQVNDLLDSLNLVLNKDYALLKKQAIDARKWIMKEKSWTNQMKRLSDWMIQLHEMEEKL